MAGQAPGFLVYFAAHAAARTVGMGFVVGYEHILTCAHVVNAALGRDLFRQDKPDLGEIVTLRLPTSGGAIREARVEAWLPPPHGGVDGGDIAGLVITGERLPTGLKPARLSREPPSEGEVRLFDYPAEPHRPAGGHLPAGNWVSCRLRLRVGDRLLQLKSDPGAAWRAQPGYSGAPVLDRASDTVVAMFKAATDDERYSDSYAIGATTLREAWGEVLGVPPRNPYKRLVAFDEEDHEVFVGREEDVARLEKAVQRSPVVLVVGPSGVGKSSLVQAGLLPALRKTGTWTVTRCRPGSMPFHELAAALFRAEGSDPGVEALRQRAAEIRGGGLADLAATIRIARGRRLLVVVDQLEELFTAGHEAALVEDFLEAILSPLTVQRGATVVATVRADFFDRLLAHPGAAPRLDGCSVPLSPLGADALRRVVREPAERQKQKVQFASGLVDRIVRDAHAEVGALPLLAFTLSELWPRQRRRVLTHEAYEEIGGLEGSLRAHAEAAITTLIENGTSAATLRRALLALISRTDDRMPVTRRACPVAELPADQQAVIDALAQARLVTTDTDRSGRRVAELAHEFLLHAWPRLADLAEFDAAFVRWRGEVEHWQAKGYDLLPDPMIAEARRWCDERPEETESIRDLVERSEAEQHRQVRELEQARDAARVAARHADELLLTAQTQPTDRLPAGLTETSVLAAESLRARRTLQGDVITPYALPASRMSHNDWVDAVTFSPDGTRVATGSHDGTARIFDVASGAEQARLTHDGPVLAVAFGPDGTRVATASSDRTARVFDAASSAEQARLAHDDWVLAVVFSPDGTRVATASDDGTARVFDVYSGAEQARLTHDGPVLAVAFSPDGTRVATASGDCTARVFDATSGAELASYEPSTAIKAVETKPVEISVESRLRWVHRRSGLTWDQIARLFGVSRRAVHSWVAGGRINAANSEHLGVIMRVLQRLPSAAPERTRELLMSSSGGAPSLFDRLRSKKVSGIAVEDTLSVRELLGMGERAED